jgi:CRISPR/Cas system-associated endoribonuclease Cas2
VTIVVNLNAKSMAALRKLIFVDEHGVAEILQVLESDLEKLRGPSATFDAASNFKAIDRETGYSILEFLTGFCISRLSRSKDWKEVVDAVLVNVTRSDVEPKLKTGELKKLEQRLKRILSNQTLALKSKAIRLQSTHDKIFLGCEVVSDIRPVYSLNGSPKIEAAMSFHMLHLEFHHEGERSTFYCALDSKDIKTLRDVLDRAVKKESAIESLLQDAKLPRFKVE